MPESSAFQVEMAIEKLKRHRSSSTDQIPKGLLKARSTKFRSEISKLTDSLWNKEELSEEWKESIIVSIYKKGDKTDCSNYRGKSLLSTSYKIISNILLSSLNYYVRKNGSTVK